MYKLARLFFAITLLLTAQPLVFSQSPPQEQKPATASIAGKVLLNGKPARGVTVTAIFEEPDMRKMLQRVMEGFASIMFRAKTDDTGQYRIENLAAGNYEVFVIAPAMVTTAAAESAPAKTTGVRNLDDDDEDEDEDEGGNAATAAVAAAANSNERQVRLADGETAKDVNFSMNRGGVITGRVTHADGRPVIGETVVLSQNQSGNNVNTGRRFSVGEADTFTTDDRGIYRIYGVADGSYRVSVTARQKGMMDAVAKGARLKTTYYPGVTEEKLAALVEVKGGAEVRGVDIKLGTAAGAFAVNGRLVEADTGKPVANVFVAYSGSGTVFGKANTPTNARGEFKLDGVPSGSYRLSTVQDMMGQSEYYADSAPFEVKEADVSGVEMKLHRGLSISGIAVIEGATDATLMTALAQQELMAISMTATAYSPDSGGMTPSYSRAQIAPDGSFAFRGVRPGKLRVGTFGQIQRSKVALTRIERGGVEVRGEIDVRLGESVNDLRVVFAAANGVIRGQVRTEDGSSLKDFNLFVTAKRAGASSDNYLFNSPGNNSAEVDPNGQFVIEGLVAGEYEVTLQATPVSRSHTKSSIPPVTQTVFVTGDGAAQVQFTIDPKAKDKDK